MADTAIAVAAGATATTAVADPSTECSEYTAMKPVWTVIGDILSGITAIRRSGEKYLPKYEGEDAKEYQRRVSVSPWRPEFDDALRSLAAKPFGKDVSLKYTGADEAAKNDVVSGRYKEIAEDIDGRGNSQTAFLAETFYNAIAYGVHGILVDYPALHPDGNVRLSVADEKRINARPYWVQLEGRNIIALYTILQEGVEVISHIRFKESYVERDGFSESRGTRIRVYEPGRWQVWQKGENDKKFTKTSEGVINRGGNKSVPIVLFFTGRRLGNMLVRPPLADLAEMQLELYRAQSRQDEVLTFAGSPMLAANGMEEPKDGGPLAVGPKTVLYAPGEKASWGYVSPDAANVKEIREQVESIIQDMRRLGMQPLIQRTGRPTATGDSIEAAKAHTVLQSWALGMKDCAEQAWVLTAQWLGMPNPPEVTIYTDFSSVSASAPAMEALATARASRDISRRTYWLGLMRLNVLSADFDPELEETAIKSEPVFETAELPKRDPATGMPVRPPPPQTPPEGQPTGQEHTTD